MFIYFILHFWLWWVFVTAHGLSPVSMSGGYSLVKVHGLLIAVSSLSGEHGL